MKDSVFDGVFISYKGSMKRFFSMLWKGKLPYFWIVFYVVLSIILTNVGINVAEYTAEMFAGNVNFLAVILPFLIYKLMNLVIGSITSIINYICIAKIDRNLRRMTWEKVVKLPMKYYEENEPKELLSRITTDVSIVSQLIMQTFIPMITSGYSIFAMLKKIGSYDIKLMFSLVAVVPLYIFVSYLLGKMNFGINDVVNTKNAELTKTIAEKSSNMLLIKAFGSEKSELDYGNKKMIELFNAGIKNSWIGQLAGPIRTIVGALQFIVIIMIGRSFYSSGALTLPEWIVYFEFSTSITNMVAAYCGYWTLFKTSEGATNRVANIMNEEEEVKSIGKKAYDISGDIKFKEVDFKAGGKEILKKLSLSISEGSITAVIGDSGSGKTTILNLIDRLYDVNNGRITIGEVNIKDYNIESYREQIAYVTQESMLLSGTIKDNILFGVKRDISQEELESACKDANAYDFINRFSKGFAAQVGEGGACLSGGQKQRIAIARAILKNPKYLLLDEATAAMDMKAKDDVWKGINNLMKGKTTILVAHDRQTVLKADNIIVLENGNIVDFGTKEELAKTSKYYKELIGEER